MRSRDGKRYWCRSLTTTSRCASRCQTCCGSSALPPRRSHRPKRSSPRRSSARRAACSSTSRCPGMSGPELQQELIRRRQEIPIVFITAPRRRITSVRASSRAGPSSACSSRSARRPCSTRSMPRFGRGRHDNDERGTLRTRPYTVTSAIASRSIEVLTMPDATPIVFVVDDDVSVRESLELLIKHAGWQPEMFASAQDFLVPPARHRSQLSGARCDACRGSTAWSCSSSSPTGPTCRSSSSPVTATCR